MLEVVGVSKKFKNTTALDDVNLTFGNKGLVVILGESGSGKSTLFNVLTGMVKADSGKVIYNDCQLNVQGKINSQNIFGIIFQENNLLGGLTVKQNLDICNTSEQKQAEILSNLGIIKYLDTKVEKLSGGEMQRVAIARALLDDNDILLADEPTGSLDEQNGENVMEILQEISKTKLVIVISHNIQFAQKYADRTIRLAKGKVMSDSGQQEEIGNDNGGQDCDKKSQSIGHSQHTGRQLSNTMLVNFCWTKIKHTFAKSITSMLIFAVVLAVMTLSMALVMTDCRHQYLKSIRRFEYSALYNDKDMDVFAAKLEGGDMQSLTKYYNFACAEAKSRYIVVDNSLKSDEIVIAGGVARTLNEKRLSQLKVGDSINFCGKDRIVKGIVQEQNCGYDFDLNFAVYLNEQAAQDTILSPNIVLVDSKYRLELDISKDESLVQGECRMGFGLYYQLATRDEQYIDLKQNVVTWRFEENNTKLFSQDFSIVGVDAEQQNMDNRTLYVSATDYEKISKSRLYYGYCLKTSDKRAVNNWLDKGVEIFNQDFDDYIRAKEIRQMLLPYVIGLIVVGAVLSMIYLMTIINHLAMVNTREICILKALGVNDKSIFGLMFVQSLPTLLCANVVVLVIDIIAKVVIAKHLQFLALQVVLSSVVALIFTLVVALVLVAVKTKKLDKKFDINMTR